jgi:hypothetical protein
MSTSSLSFHFKRKYGQANKIYQSKYEAQATAKLTLSNSGIKLVISNVQPNTKNWGHVASLKLSKSYD